MSRWYRACTYGSPAIEEVESDRVTDKSIWINGRRNNIEGRYYSYFSERSDAVQHIIDHHKRDVEAAERHLEYCRNHLLRAIALGDG